MKNKKAISPMIGYILLISAAILMSVIVYTWLKTYVPNSALECPDTTSIFIKSYTCDSNQLNLTIKNNGNFNVAGYFIRIANVSGQELATVDLSQKLVVQFGGVTIGNSVLFDESNSGNSFAPNEEAINVFDIVGTETIYFIELTPIRIEEINNRNRTASCGNAKIKEEITC
ncbi:hypothetical protein KAI04_03730 [Candidatus Pacearchaeota archaeon]|nr:hypothetical protein [Candidatus Pacearchaeota archaeon]